MKLAKVLGYILIVLLTAWLTWSVNEAFAQEGVTALYRPLAVEAPSWFFVTGYGHVGVHTFQTQAACELARTDALATLTATNKKKVSPACREDRATPVVTPPVVVVPPPVVPPPVVPPVVVPPIVALPSALTVLILSPSPGSTLRGMATVVVTVSGAVGVVTLVPEVGSTNLLTMMQALGSTATFTFDTTKFPNAPHTLWIRATDSAGRTVRTSIPIVISNP